MANLRTLPLLVLTSALISLGVSPAQTASPSVTPERRIVDTIDDNQLVTLKGNTHPAARPANDRGAVSPSLPMTDLILVLSRSPERQAAFDAYVASLSDPNSPNYHQWLTPEQVGEQYGPSPADIATVTGWLASRGFTVTLVTNDRMSIRFNGTARLVSNAFHTEIHNLVVNGAPHIGNMSDPQIPAALAPVIIGIKSLHNFFPRPLHHIGQSVTRDSQTGHWLRPSSPAAATASHATTAASGTARPQFGISVGGTNPYLVEDVGPWDFATIYNVTPLWNAGIDGTGQTIAIAGTSAIDIGESSTAVVGANGSDDVGTFRTFFNLPTNNSWNKPIQISGNSQPLTVCTSSSATAPCGIGDLEENTLDVEWSASVAKNAQIVLVASYPASTTDDNLYDSESYIVNHLTARIMNVSYGACELGLGTAGNVQYYNLWQTAAAEGIAVFVASGDAGAASCDANGDSSYGVPYPAEYGLSVNGLASTPFNTSVGGTDFNWCPLTTTDGCKSEAATYWNSSNSTPNESNAKGYVPEVPWDDTCTSPVALSFMESFFSGFPYQASNGKTYSVTDAESGCNALVYYSTQLQQAGDNSLLYLVDTVGTGGGASGCVVSDGMNPSSCAASTTSTGSSNGNIPLHNDGWIKPGWQSGVAGIPSDGVRDVPDVSFFASDGFLSSSAYLVCVSAASQDPECTYSSSSEPFALEVGGTSVATPTMAGVMALINQKTGAAQGSPNAELYSLAARQNYGSCKAENGSASSSCYFNDIDTGNNAMACDYSAFVQSPSPNCSVAHSGDYVGILPGYNAGAGYDLATGLGSLNVANVVNAWTTTTGLTMPTVTVTPSPASINSSNSLTVTVTVAGGSGAPVPTGTVMLSASGSSYSATGTLSSSGAYTFTIPANTLPGSAAGTSDTLTANYAGDANYAASSGTVQVTVVTTVALLTPSITVTPASQTLNSNAGLNVTVSVTGSGVAPTGTITLSGGGYSGPTQTIGTSPCSSNSSCVFTIPANTLTGSATGQADPLTATYSGNGVYAAGTGTAQVTVTSSTFTLTAGTPSSSSVTPGTSATVAIAIKSLAGYTGTVSLTCQQTSTTASGGDGTSCTGGGSATAVNLTSSSTSGSVTFTVGTSAKMTASLHRPEMSRPGSRGNGILGATSGSLLALVVFFGIPSRRRGWRSMLTLLLAFVAIGFMSSCGGGGGGSSNSSSGGTSDPGTTAGTYTYTVTATPNPSVTPAVTTTFTVTVN